MKQYNYKEAVREDIKYYLVTNFGTRAHNLYGTTIENVDEFIDEQVEKIPDEDSITGCMFGYEMTGNVSMKDAVFQNWEGLLDKALDSLGWYINEGDYDYYYDKIFENNDYSYFDCAIRTHLAELEAYKVIIACLDEGLLWVESDHEDEGIPADDEDYDEGFDESLEKAIKNKKTKHRKRF